MEVEQISKNEISQVQFSNYIQQYDNFLRTAKSPLHRQIQLQLDSVEEKDLVIDMHKIKMYEEFHFYKSNNHNFNQAKKVRLRTIGIDSQKIYNKEYDQSKWSISGFMNMVFPISQFRIKTKETYLEDVTEVNQINNLLYLNVRKHQGTLKRWFFKGNINDIKYFFKKLQYLQTQIIKV